MSHQLLFWSIEKGLNFLGDAVEKSVDSKMFHRNMRQVILKSVKSAMKECGDNGKWNVWDNYKLMKYLSKQDMSAPGLLLGEAIRDIMQEYFRLNKKEKMEITETWMKIYSKRYIFLCSQSPVLSHYILLCTLQEARRKDSHGG